MNQLHDASQFVRALVKREAGSDLSNDTLRTLEMLFELQHFASILSDFSYHGNSEFGEEWEDLPESHQHFSQWRSAMDTIREMLPHLRKLEELYEQMCEGIGLYRPAIHNALYGGQHNDLLKDFPRWWAVCLNGPIDGIESIEYFLEHGDSEDANS